MSAGDTLRFLENLRRSFETLSAVDPNPYPYTSEADFILRHGREWPLPRRRRRIQTGPLKDCFRNAARLALRFPKRFTYVEGYAFFGPLNTPMEHAWCIDRAGFVADPTWVNGHDYFGVPFRHDYLRAIVLAKNGYGLIDNEEMELPLLTRVHPAEYAVLTVADEVR